MSARTWVVVLIKDFDSAKQRLGPVMDLESRRAFAAGNAEKAVRAAAAGRCLVVAGSAEAADFARRLGADVLVEPRQEGQNVAAARGIKHAVKAGARSVLILSSDLPLVTRDVVAEMLAMADRIQGRVVVAAPATARGGTNALYLRPPQAVRLHFGTNSLARFRDDAARSGVHFAVHSSEALALDVDEPSDLAKVV